MVNEEDKAPPQKTALERERFDELEDGLLKIFRNTVYYIDNYDNDAQERIAGAHAAQALLTLYRDFTPK